MPLQKWRGGYIRNGIYYIDLGDHRHRFSTGTRNLKDALTALAEFYRGEGAYLRGNRAQVSLNEAITEYLKHSAAKNSRRHVEEQGRGFDRWVRFFSEHRVTHLEQITSAVVLEFQQWRLSGSAWQVTKWHKKKRERLSTASFNRDLAYLTALLSWARDTDRIPVEFDPLRKVRQLPEHQGVRPHREITRSDILAVRAKLIPRWRDAVTVLYGTCMRYGSLCRIGPSAIDVGRRVVRDAKPKGKRAVEVTVTKEVLEAALRCAEMRFPDDNAQQLDRRLKTACRAARVPKFTAHDLRVSGATHLHRDGMPLKDLQQLLGHAELRTTERYVRAYVGAARGPELEPVAIPSQTSDGVV